MEFNKSFLYLIVGFISVVFIGLFLVISSSNNAVNENNSDKDIKTVSAVDFADVNNSEDVITIDVRTPKEYEQNHIPGAINIDYYAPDFQKQLEELDKNKRYKIYCRSGSRSASTLKMMDDMGFAKVENLRGGIIAWTNAGFELQPCTTC